MSTTEARGAATTDFIPVALSNFQVDSITNFDIYIRPVGTAAPVLYRHKNQPFSDSVRARLVNNQIATVLIEGHEEAAYQRYMERHLGDLLRDDRTDISVKSHIFYDTARGLVRQVLEAPRSGDVLKRGSQLVEHTVEFMLREHAALENIMKIASFDYYTYTHSVNVFVFSLAMAQRLNLASDALKPFALGALLHDVGKGLIGQDIINRNGPLSPAEWEMMKMHPVYSDEILHEQGVTDALTLEVARHHHEKLTGRGYPDGLTPMDIPKCVRIATIADIFDALTTRRSYKDAMSSFSALTLMKNEMAEELDGELFREFVLMVGHPSELPSARPQTHH